MVPSLTELALASYHGEVKLPIVIYCFNVNRVCPLGL